MDEVIELAELRIGNYLEHKGKVVSVTSLDMDIEDESEDTIGFTLNGSDEIYGWNRALYNDLKRIALTPEILEKGGGEKIGADYKFDWLTLYAGHDDWFIIIGGKTIHIQYIHEWQNTYYWLFKKELEQDLTTIKKK